MESSCQIRALSGILIIVYKKQKKYKRVMEMLDRLELKAYGKINLGLDVVRKREDGYHGVRMIMQTVHLHDRIVALSGILIIVYKKQKKYKRVMEMLDRLELKAYGKINLGLDVVRKREDGYHGVRMIMQTVHLHDRIVMEKTKEPGIRTETNLPYVPDGEGNLAWRAAKLLMDEFGLSEGVDIKIRKCIPVAAGMAGGSTDAAAVLVGMNRLFGLGLGKKELMRRGVKLGADIPYCILRGTALSEGIGEILTELPPAPQCHVVLAKPQISVSTKVERSIWVWMW